jgi:alkaline phosphatase D
MSGFLFFTRLTVSLVSFVVVCTFIANTPVKIYAMSNPYSGTVLPDGMNEDLFVPFTHGVASGDPNNTSVLLWTRRKPSSLVSTTDFALSWQVSTDATFSAIISSGSASALHTHNWAVTVEATGLSADTEYFFRFRDTTSGNYSRVGRTYTAAAAAAAASPSGLHIGVMSCSSVYSSYLSSLRTLADDPKVRVVVHVGDLLYDTVDTDEQVRVPSPCNADADPLANIAPVCFPEAGAERVVNGSQYASMWRYLLLDQDLRYLRSQKPMIYMWDNHDVKRTVNDSFAVARNFVPMRTPGPTPSNELGKAYRTIRYGKLVDFVLLDTQTRRELPADPTSSSTTKILGSNDADQYTFLTDALTQSKSDGIRWRIIASTKQFSRFSAEELPTQLDPSRGGKNYFDDGSWDGYTSQRTQVLDFLAANNIVDNIIITGDSHIGTAADMYDIPSLDAWDENNYCPSTSVFPDCSSKVNYQNVRGVEFQPPSVNRGNLDEDVGTGNAIADALVNGVVNTYLRKSNPHIRRMALSTHGYGIMEVHRNYTRARIHFFDKFSATPALQDTWEFWTCAGDQLGVSGMDDNAPSSYRSNHWDNDCSCIHRQLADACNTDADDEIREFVRLILAALIILVILVIILCYCCRRVACCQTGTCLKCNCCPDKRAATAEAGQYRQEVHTSSSTNQGIQLTEH